jgi:hypothetical protein
MTMVLLIAGLLTPWFFAYALVRRGDPGHPAGGRWLHACLAVGIGMGLSSCTCFLWSLCVTWPGTAFWIVESFGFAVAGLVLMAAPRRARPSTAAAPTMTPPRLRCWHMLLAGVFITVLALDAIGLWGRYAANPHGQWDAWSKWNMRARMFFGLGDRWRQAFEPGHPDVEYPLLVPLTNARCWSCLGRDPPWVPAAVGALFALATAGVLAAGVARLRSRALGLLAGTVLLGTEAFISLSAWQYADVPLAFFIVATVLLLALDDVAERSSRGLLLAAGLCAALAAWTKNEGWLFLVAVLAVRVVVAWRRGGARQMLRQSALLLAGAAPLVAVVMVFKFSVAPTGNDLVGGQSIQATLPRLADAWRYWLVAKAMVHHAVASGDWQVVILPLCFFLLGRGPRRPRLALPGIVGVLGLMLAGYFLVYLTTPHDLKWHLSTSVSRLLMHLWPVAILAVFLSLSDPVQLLVERSPASPVSPPGRRSCPWSPVPGPG